MRVCMCLCAYVMDCSLWVCVCACVGWLFVGLEYVSSCLCLLCLLYVFEIVYAHGSCVCVPVCVCMWEMAHDFAPLRVFVHIFLKFLSELFFNINFVSKGGLSISNCHPHWDWVTVCNCSIYSGRTPWQWCLELGL